MTKSIKLALVAAMAMGATSAFATNGSTMIGVGAKARGMGGVGIATSFGAESGLLNPSLITSVEGSEFSFGGTLFMPDVSTTNTAVVNPVGPVTATSSADSASDTFVIPSVSFATKVADGFYVGLGMWGTGGLGVDYRETPSVLTGTGQHMQMVTAVQIMQFGVPLAYETEGFSIGITPVIQYGALDINYEYPGSSNLLDPNAPGDQMGAGVNDDLKLGVNLGLSYDFAKAGVDGLTVGAMYKSQIDMEYKGVMSTVVAPFSTTGVYANDKLSTPAEMGLGLSYKMAEHTVGLDYKQIKWSDAKGYQDFGWVDQDVVAIGYEYNPAGWAVRVGYQYAPSAVEAQDVAFNALGQETNFNSANLSAGTVNTFNLLGFPGTQETHVSIGGTYEFSKQTSLDLAFVQGLENEVTATNFYGQDITTAHSEQSLSVQMNFAF